MHWDPWTTVVLSGTQEMGCLSRMGQLPLQRGSPEGQAHTFVYSLRPIPTPWVLYMITMLIPSEQRGRALFAEVVSSIQTWSHPPFPLTQCCVLLFWAIKTQKHWQVKDMLLLQCRYTKGFRKWKKYINYCFTSHLNLQYYFNTVSQDLFRKMTIDSFK